MSNQNPQLPSTASADEVISKAIKPDALDSIYEELWTRRNYAYGTGELFQKRATELTKRLNLLSFFGLFLPILVGAVALSELKILVLPSVIYIASAVGVLQVIATLYSITEGWPSELMYAIDSAKDNFEISSQFQDLAQTSDNPPTDLKHEMTVLITKDNARRAQDRMHNIKPKEMIYFYRASLFKGQRKCVKCKKVPDSMSRTSCETCGRY